MSEDGWIKLHRKFLKWSMFQDSEAVHLWIHLLLSAQQQEFKYYIRSLKKEIILKPGQMIKSIRTLSKETGIDRNKIHRLLKDYKNCAGIETVEHGIFTCITITKWDDYQKSETNLRQMRDRCETDVRQEQECKNERMKERINISDFVLTEDLKVWSVKTGFTGNIEEELERWKDHHMSKGTKIKDYAASFRTWIRNAVKWCREKESNTNSEDDYYDSLLKGDNNK